MNLDITFCSKKTCENYKCERNQNRSDFYEVTDKQVWIGNFEKCKYWRKDKNEN